MKQLFCAGLLFVGSFSLLGADSAEELVCQKTSHLFARADSPDARQYASSREFDILHLKLDVTSDFKQRIISGTATLTFKPIAGELNELQLDAIDLVVSSVVSSEAVESFKVTDKKTIVTFAKPISPDKEARGTIHYSAESTPGLYFRTPEMGYKEGETHLFSQAKRSPRFVLPQNWPTI